MSMTMSAVLSDRREWSYGHAYGSALTVLSTSGGTSARFEMSDSGDLSSVNRRQNDFRRGVIMFLKKRGSAIGVPRDGGLNNRFMLHSDSGITRRRNPGYVSISVKLVP